MSKRMRAFRGFGMLTVVLLCGAAASAQTISPPPEGTRFPGLRIPAPLSGEHLKYLGLKGRGDFEISQVKAELVVIQVLSMYCPHCQREAPLVNELYALIDARPDVKGKIKLLGIGAGNTSFEVDLFRKKYNIPFPVIPDPDLKLHRLLGEVRTPYFIAVKLTRDGQQRVVYSRAGSPGEPAQFLDSLLRMNQGQ